MKKLILFLCLWGNLCLAANIKVVDGDSLEIDGVRIRLDGIDAPEFFQTCEDINSQEYECGQESTAYLKNLIAENEVHCNCEQQPDKYQRQICECFIDNLSLNKEMVRQGQARAYRSHKYSDDENYAEANRSGIWQGRHMRPALYRTLKKYEEK